MDSLKSKTQNFFVRDDVTGDGRDAQCLEKKIREYNKTGKFNLPAKKTFDDRNKQTSLANSTNVR